MRSTEAEILIFGTIMLFAITFRVALGRSEDVRDEGQRVLSEWLWRRRQELPVESECERRVREWREEQDFWQTWRHEPPWGKTLRVP